MTLDAGKDIALAKKSAYRLLRSRPRSESEIRQRLGLKGYSQSLISGIVDELKKAGDIDDGKFARFWIESRMHCNPAGSILLRHELKQKGVAEQVIEAALQAIGSEHDEFEAALTIAREKYERLKKLDRRKAAKRVYDFLMRRGFGYETIQRVVQELVASV